MPLQEEAGLVGCLCYEELIEAERQHVDGFQWVRVDENDACGLCYTSGTTGRPKVPHASNFIPWPLWGALSSP